MLKPTKYCKALCVMITVAITASSCKKDKKDDPTVDPPGNASGVYIGYTAGYQWHERSAKIWKDGSDIQSLADSTTCAYITGMTVTDAGDVYAVGCECRTLRANLELDNDCDVFLWKNGVKQKLTENSFNYSRNVELFVADNGDVYVASDVPQTGYTEAPIVLWKNGQEQIITDGNVRRQVNDLFVAGSDIYIAGSQNDASSPYEKPALWKNSVYQSTTDPSITGTTKSIWIDGNDVYSAVSSQTSGFYKNNNLIATSVGINTAGQILMSGGSVYMLAQTSAYKWVVIKDGTVLFELQPVADNDDTIYGRALAVKGNDVYVVGEDYVLSTNKEHIILWKNGQVSETLSDGNNLYVDAQTLVVK